MTAQFVLAIPGQVDTEIVRRDAPAPPVPVRRAPRHLRWDDDAFYLVAGGGVVRIDRRPPHAEVMLAQAPVIGDLVLDRARGELIWAEGSTVGMRGGDAGVPGRIAAVATAGGPVRTVRAGVDARSLLLVGDDLWASDGSALVMLARAGTAAPRVVVPDCGMAPLLRAGAEAPGWVYFTRHGGVSRVDAAGRVEPLIDGVAIPIGLALDGADLLVLANAVLSRPRPELAEPARLIRVRPGAPPTTLWSRADVLVGHLEVVAGLARITWRTVDGLAPTLLELDLHAPAASPPAP